MIGLSIIIWFTILLLIFISAALGYWVISKLWNYKFFSESYGIFIVMILGFAICSLPIFLYAFIDRFVFIPIILEKYSDLL